MSSLTSPSFSGTLKSTRMKTRLPFRSRSLMVSLLILIRDPWLVIRNSWRKSDRVVAEILLTWGAAVLRPYMIALGPRAMLVSDA